MSELESNGVKVQGATGPDQATVGRGAPGFSPGSLGLGSAPPERSTLPVAVWAVAALIVAAVLGVLMLAGRHHAAATPNTLQPADSYAISLPLSQLEMSESSSVSGVKMTYLDGHVQNTGSRTMTGATVQVIFKNDEGLSPQVETLPLTLVRTREPYVDTEPVSANPLKTGADREFRLIFESVPVNWNTQMPEIRVIATELR